MEQQLPCEGKSYTQKWHSTHHNSHVQLEPQKESERQANAPAQIHAEQLLRVINACSLPSAAAGHGHMAAGTVP